MDKLGTTSKAASDKATSAVNKTAAASDAAADSITASMRRASDANNNAATNAAAAANKTENANKKAAAASDIASTATRRAGDVALQAGYQVQDFAVQVGAGTSAFTAFAQNAPQFLSVFGPKGAVVGALVAVGAVAAKVFLDMGDDAKSASEKAEELADTIDQIGKNAAAAIREDIDFGKSKLEQAKIAAQNFADEVSNAAQNQIDYNATVLESFNNLLAAERTLRDVKGETISKVKDLAAEEKAAAEARAAQVQIQIQSEQLKLQAAEDSVEIEKQALAEARVQKAEKEALLQTERNSLQVLRDQRDALEEQAKQRMGILQAAASSFAGEGGFPGQATAGAKAAQAQLDTGAVAGQMSVIENRISELEKAVASTGELSQAVETATQSLQQSESALRQTQSDVSTSIASIAEIAASEDVKAQAKAAEEKAKAFAAEIEGMIAGIEPTNQQQSTALENLNVLLKDNQIKQNEIATATSSLATLSPLISQSITNNTTSVTQLISIMNSFQSQNSMIQRQIDDLQSRMRTTLPQR
jgi:chromosome segregation ATPase